MFPAFIAQSYKFVITRKLWGEFALMLMYWPLIWGTLLYQLGALNTLYVALTVNFVLSPWLAFGLGCETLTEEESKDMSWMELQMRGSRSLSGGMIIHWFYGGLNTQIEHHIFPKAPRFNLLEVKRITQRFAKENNLFYFETSPIKAYIQINDEIKKY